jgi:hypothetical protein
MQTLSGVLYRCISGPLDVLWTVLKVFVRMMMETPNYQPWRSYLIRNLHHPFEEPMAGGVDLGASPYVAERRRALAGKSGWVNNYS